MSDLHVDQTVNQAQAQSQSQQQEQGQLGFPLVHLSVLPIGGQLASATNQNVIVGNIGAVSTGPQNANAVNVGGFRLGIPRVVGSSLHTSTAADGTVTSVLKVPGVTVTVVTPPGGTPEVTVVPDTPVAPAA
jgi:hypothetical protein